MPALMYKEALHGPFPLGSSSHSQAMLEPHLSSLAGWALVRQGSPIILRLPPCNCPGSSSGQTTSSHCRCTGWPHSGGEQAGSDRLSWPRTLASWQEDTQGLFQAAAPLGAVRAAGRERGRGQGQGLGCIQVPEAPGGADGLTAGRCDLAQSAPSASLPCWVGPYCQLLWRLRTCTFHLHLPMS